MTDIARVVIVGAGAGGDACATGLRKQGFKGEVVLIGQEPLRPYERPFLSKQFLRGEIPDQRTFLRPENAYDELGIELRLATEVVGADRNRGELELGNGERLGFDALVLATGATPRSLPGAPSASNVFTLRSFSDAVALRNALADAERVLLVGAGFIGAEVAASARMLGKAVLTVEIGEVPMERALGRPVGEIYARIHRSRGVDLRLATGVSEWIEDGDRVTAVRLTDGSLEEIDLAVIAVGVTPNVGLANGLGLDTERQAVWVDEHLRAATNIYAVGDIAAHLHPVYHRRLRVEHWQVAQRQGTGVARAITGDPEPYTELPWFWSDQYDVNLQYVGNAPESDRHVIRGEPEDERFSVFYLNKGLVDAVLSVNDGRTGRFSRPLISRRLAIPESTLADPTADLREAARQE